MTVLHQRDAATANDTVAESGVQRSPLPDNVQPTYTVRHVAAVIEAEPRRFHVRSGASVRPVSGDLVIARITKVNNHKRVETPVSRRATLFPGNLVMLAYGNRYAADQFLAHVPDSLGPTHLVAAGGVAGHVTVAHASVGSPTEIEPIGLLADADGVVNLTRFAPYRNVEPEWPVPADRPPVIAVLGTSMNSGKSTAMAHLINGLAGSGLTVMAGKITGTGAGNDPMIYRDAGATRVLDFTDFGYPTTFKMEMEAVRSLSVNLVKALTDSRTDVIVVEIADGIYQEETARLLRDDLFHELVDSIVFAATDALGALAGVQALHAARLSVATVSGVVTSSPLATAEAREVLLGFDVPVVGTFDLSDPRNATALLPGGEAVRA